MIDLHTHSTASDGTFSPVSLMQEAKRVGLNTIALTDHDTIDGCEEARSEAKRLGIRFIAGCEIAIDWHYDDSASLTQDSSFKHREFHLLALDIKTPSGGFLSMMEELKTMRYTRNLIIIEKMKEMGVMCNYEDLLSDANNGVIGRPHFAKFLVEQKKAKTIQVAFDKYLGRGKSLYVEKECVDLQKAITCIKDSGALPFLAHPSTLYVSWGKLPQILSMLRDQGIVGIEAYHPLLNKNQAQRMEEIARTLGMFVSAGSDFHGISRKDRKLGYTSGGIKIEDKWMPPPLLI
ncbi:MAG: PHP domain-containing protein [Termitinemataceae bacterium]|nr:MAG: PHP domain-containing protein [Termitinemataceae bacterium]